MSAHIKKVARNIEAFTEILVRDRVDFQMGFVVSSETSGRNLRPGLYGPHPVVRGGQPDVNGRVVRDLEAILAEFSGGIEAGISILVDAIAYPLNQVLFRADSARAFVVLTDAHDNFLQAKDLPAVRGAFDNFSGPYPWTVIGIGHPVGAPDCGVEMPNHDLLQSLALGSGGAMGNVCDDDFTPILERAATQIVKMLDSFSFSDYPELAYAKILFIKVVVDGVEIPADSINGYEWNQTELAIKFHGRSVPRPGAKIAIDIEFRVGGA